jgi:hypothetical protein
MALQTEKDQVNVFLLGLCPPLASMHEAVQPSVTAARTGADTAYR